MNSRFAVAALALALVCIALVASVQGTTPRSQAKVTSLPNLTFTPNFDSYAGYITLNGTTKNYFYWFFTSQNQPSTDPLVLWLQGGPGCSGLDGLMSENGPFTPSADGHSVNLKSKYYSWNRVSNLLYIESPCGVGFSYSDSESDYKTGDNQTALDNYQFLLQFAEIYPEWNNNPLFITGESYGGVYIPTLANQILFNTTTGSIGSVVKKQLQKGGLMLGNPVTRCEGAAFGGKDDIEFMNTRVNLFYWHALVSRRAYDNWMNNQCNTASPPDLFACVKAFSQVVKEAGPFHQPNARTFMHHDRFEAPAPSKIFTNPDCLYYSFCSGNGTIAFDTERVPDCFNTGDQTVAYYNDPSVQAAIHAKATRWSACRPEVGYKQDSGEIMPYIQTFFDTNPSMRILYYSGDIDVATVPFANTQRCLETLQQPIVDEWRPWVVKGSKEVAGYVEVYKNFQYATLKAAGHEAPQYQPASAYTLFTTFLENGVFPKP